eukprot:jgi/Botrbrau1/2522/Bobra.0079s0014.1
MRVANCGIFAFVVFVVRCHALGKPSQVCETCKAAIGVSQAWLKTPAAGDILTELLQNELCVDFLQYTEDQCKRVVPLVLPTLVAFLESWDARALCEDIDLCISANATKLQIEVAMVEALGGASNGVPCPLCQLAITTIKTQLSDPGNQKYIWDKANEVCAEIPIPDLSANCTAFVAEKLPKLFALVEDLDPSGICVDILHACPPRPPPGELAVAVPLPRKLPPNLARLSASIQTTLHADLGSNCDTCKAVITEASLLLSNPDTQKEILDIAKNACEAFQQYKDQCVTYLELYGPLLFNMIVQYLQPQLCITLGYCTPAHMQKFLPGATFMVS